MEDKSLMDYFQSHVVTIEEYLKIMQQKAMDREVVEHIKKKKKKKNTYNVDYN
jgi:hypothetical protein